tara:strand:+ start:1194 stop:1352 length:159 start_codon:yes stop_codon:yes gene_type:complete
MTAYNEYQYKLLAFERAVREVVSSHPNLDKDSKAGILLEFEEELRKQYEEEN